jgi:hypothetical protein
VKYNWVLAKLLIKGSMLISQEDIVKIAKKVVRQYALNPTFRQVVDIFNKDFNRNITTIFHSINDGSYQFADLQKRQIPKSNGKHRTIYQAEFRDAIVFKIIQQYLTDKLSDQFSVEQTAFRKKSNAYQQSLKIARKFVRGKYNGYTLLKLDIHDYYNSIDVKLLLSRLKPLLDNEIFIILAKFFNKVNIVPQGISSMNILANFYLIPFDNEFKKTGIYRRYADDIILITKVTDVQSILAKMRDELYQYMIQYKYGETTTPELPQKKSLNNSVEHFRDCVLNNKQPITSKQSIINVIKALEIISKV